MHDHSTTALIASSPPARPLLIYDGDCGFCRRWIARFRHITGDRILYAASQEVGGQYPEIAPEQFKRSVQLITPEGHIFSGAEAIFRSLAHVPRWGWALRLYHDVPGICWLSEATYRFVARHRGEFS